MQRIICVLFDNCVSYTCVTVRQCFLNWELKSDVFETVFTTLRRELSTLCIKPLILWWSDHVTFSGQSGRVGNVNMGAKFAHSAKSVKFGARVLCTLLFDKINGSTL